ncbi:uncharacterized protein BJ212DRAFT_1512407 [Suillus subaureus]|uniref:Uncharacterized protein n=1 Tax=Suillus subaureus TaxID=48587 RepID=A0A9P7JCK8_9AGAM|nr:uncharacterized protein BJ212DRAFT_1512407 [Suillus subaureus]KAG1814702.1 hypothetical protein BJ212DRAFT_1512407 [Suillus subaureus]
MMVVLQVCKALRQTYMSSSELQYIVELSGQWLLHVPNMDNVNIPVCKRLQLLRDKAHAWFKVDAHSFETVSLPKDMHSDKKFVVDEHLYLWDKEEDMATIVPILPKPSQKIVKRGWSPGTLFSVPDSDNLDVFMDPAQNLITAYAVTDDTLQSNKETLYIDLGVLDSDGAHPRAAGWTLFLSVPPASKDKCFVTERGCGSCIFGTGNTQQHLMLLVVADDLKFYSIEDMSQMPQLLVCFLMPVPFPNLRCLLLMDRVDSSPQMQAQQTMYTSDPQNRLLCITTEGKRAYVISMRIFFNLDGIVAATPVPWERWGPSNTRIFELSGQSRVHVSGNRVLQALLEGNAAAGPLKHTLHIMDFSLLAVTNRRGLGERAIYNTRPRRVDWQACNDLDNVTLDRKFGSAESELADAWVDKDRIYLLNRKWDYEVIAIVTHHGPWRHFPGILRALLSDPVFL